MSLALPFAFNSWVRIDATNGDIYAKINGVTDTFTITAGTYWFGFGEENGGNDSDIWGGGTSLLQQMETDLGWHVALEFEGHINLTNPTNSGHVWIDPMLATDVIYWTNALTTVDPSWFGTTNGADYSFSSTIYEDISTFSSTLAFVAHRSMVTNLLTEVEIERSTKTDNKKQYFYHYETETLRDLRVACTGRPAEDNDNTYHSMRRWLHQLTQAQMGRRFYFWSDLTAGRGFAWDIDGATDGARHGREDIQRDGERSPNQERRYSNTDAEWIVRIPVQEYVT